jgi:hypothetical protein
MTIDLPRIISADDHVIEPPDVWVYDGKAMPARCATSCVAMPWPTTGSNGSG